MIFITSPTNVCEKCEAMAGQSIPHAIKMHHNLHMSLHTTANPYRLLPSLLPHTDTFQQQRATIVEGIIQ